MAWCWASSLCSLGRVAAAVDSSDENVCPTTDNGDDDETSCRDPCVDDDLCEEKVRVDPHQACDTDEWMLQHCPTLCHVCVSTDDGRVRRHNAGTDKIPPAVSLQILRHSPQSNLYLQQYIQSNPLLTLSDKKRCHDHHDMCAFWAVRGRCTDPTYQTYMHQECPLSCRHVCELQRGQAFLTFLFGTLTEAYNNKTAVVEEETKNNPTTPSVVDQRHQTLAKFMTTVGMDPRVLGQAPVTDNWLLELHTRLTLLVPDALWKLYDDPTTTMSIEDAALLRDLHNLEPKETVGAMVQAELLLPYRNRGTYIVSAMRDVDHLLTRAIQLGVGFAIPNEAALTALERIAKDYGRQIIHMGAGTGYWASLLKHRGMISVQAYDLHPPSTTENAFFDVQYDPTMKQGNCVDVFANGSNSGINVSQTTLLLIWPNDPDPVDNPQFLSGGEDTSQAVWDADCLLAFHQAGGPQVVYVGERGPDSLSGTRRFHALLAAHYTLQETIPLPHWWLNEDDMTIWNRKS